MGSKLVEMRVGRPVCFSGNLWRSFGNLLVFWRQQIENSNFFKSKEC